MKCPECNSEPTSMLNFFVMGSKRLIECNNCGTRLKAARNLRIGNVIMLVLITIALIIIVNSEAILHYKVSFWLGGGIMLLLWLMIVSFLWMFGSLEKPESDVT